jgi:hypothetical protein
MQGQKLFEIPTRKKKTKLNLQRTTFCEGEHRKSFRILMNMSYLNMEFSKLIPYSTDMCVEPAPVLGCYSGVFTLVSWHVQHFSNESIIPIRISPLELVWGTQVRFQ